MPKIVDHEAKRKQLGEAVWRIIRREGLEGVSVRSVAKEAGMSLGALRYYFSSQNDLLAFSLKMVGERIKKRIENLSMTGDIRKDIETIIGETLPLDEERITEAIIWLAFIGKSLADPTLGVLAAEAQKELYALYKKLTDALIRCGLVPPETNAELEAIRLHALIDGLVIHALIDPRTVTPETIRRTIAYHLNSIMQKHTDHRADTNGATSP
ncbi:MAG: TetR family transcriptional regulator [Bacillus thermozeamaize]|uniref:TetR family transcriptional regulator n=1 Tax=Bacillus thermozeamaize TaxID=230954 RepID=A0A1Y3PFG6_9BACI|nr:MAG: TetR family transcriptional regulator [Bacillus thermozeamaize]